MNGKITHNLYFFHTIANSRPKLLYTELKSHEDRADEHKILINGWLSDSWVFYFHEFMNEGTLSFGEVSQSKRRKEIEESGKIGW